jgi:hypothetical protein
LLLLVIITSMMCGCGATPYVRHSSSSFFDNNDEALSSEDFLFGVGPPSYRTLGTDAAGAPKTTTTEAGTSSTDGEYYEDDGDGGGGDGGAVPGRGRRHLERPQKWATRLVSTNDTCLMTRKGEYLVIQPNGRVKGTQDLAVAWQRCEYSCSHFQSIFLLSSVHLFHLLLPVH